MLKLSSQLFLNEIKCRSTRLFGSSPLIAVLKNTHSAVSQSKLVETETKRELKSREIKKIL